MTTMRPIETERLRLEPQIAAHAEEMFIILSDPAIYQYENAPPPSLDWLRTRYEKLTTRRSADGCEQWLNWVVRSHEGAPMGFAQATIFSDHRAGIAYEFASEFWGQGFASEAVGAMIVELVSHYEVTTLSAVLKGANQRSMRLLQRLGFSLATPARQHEIGIEPDEILMLRNAN